MKEETRKQMVNMEDEGQPHEVDAMSGEKVGDCCQDCASCKYGLRDVPVVNQS